MKMLVVFHTQKSPLSNQNQLDAAKKFVTIIKTALYLIFFLEIPTSHPNGHPFTTSL